MAVVKKATKPAEHMLTTARIQLVISKPFWGHIALHMPFIESVSAGGHRTTAVDEYGRMFYNKDWVEGMDIHELIFELAHEVMHIVQHCQDRFPPGADPGVWNLAADYCADTMLVEAGFKQSDVSKKMVPDNVQKWVKGKTIEQVYWQLLKNGENKGSGGTSQAPGNGDRGPNVPGNNHHKKNIRGCASASTLGKNNNPEETEKFKQHVIAAAQVAKSKGDCPGFADDFIITLLEPKITWRDKLRNMTTSVFKGRYSFARPSRRSDAIGSRLPARRPCKEGAIIAIDTSGSISDGDLNQFVTECVQIMKETGCPWLKIFFHDVQCYHSELYNFESIQKIKVTRGGTSHVDVFEKMKEEEKVGIAVCFTDLFTNFPPEEPPFPVIWAHTPDGSGQGVPWGTKVQVDLND